MGLFLNTQVGTEQRDQKSFVGGVPHLPEGRSIPYCEFCGEPQSFLFQVAIPEGIFWAGKTIAVFFCTACVNENSLIPQMPEGSLLGATVTQDFLEEYQRNFAFIVFNTSEGRPVDSYREKVAFCEVNLSESEELENFGRLGGMPLWLMGDETPGAYSGRPMKFLLQLNSDVKFPILPTAPPQIELDIYGNAVPSAMPYYTYFLGNAVYLFGTDKAKPLVYALTQCD